MSGGILEGVCERTVGQRCDALKGDPEVVWIEESGGVVEELDVLRRRVSSEKQTYGCCELP